MAIFVPKGSISFINIPCESDKGFETNDENKLMVRGYVTFLCGEQEITVYSATVNRSVAGIREGLESN